MPPKANKSEVPAKADPKPAAATQAISPELEERIRVQGEKVRQLKANNADPAEVKAAVSELLALKKEAGIEVPAPKQKDEGKAKAAPTAAAPVQAAAPAETAAAPAAPKAESKKAEAKPQADVLEEIKVQEDKVRDLKSKRAAYDDVKAAVDRLVELKIKAGLPVQAGAQKKEAPPAAAAQPEPKNEPKHPEPKKDKKEDPKKEKEKAESPVVVHAGGTDKVTAQAEKVRQLKSNKAPPAEIEAAVALLKTLKAEAGIDPNAGSNSSKKTENKDVAASAAPAEGTTKKGAKKGVEIPVMVQHRCRVWDECAQKRKQDTKPSLEKISVMCDGKAHEGRAGETTPLDIAGKHRTDLVVAKVDGKYWDLHRPLAKSCTLEVFKFDSPEGKHAFWHSSAHVLGQSLELVFQNAQLCIGPPVEDGGFYYDVFLGDDKVTPEHFAELQKVIKRATSEAQPFVRIELKKDEALEMFKHNPFKLELINKKVEAGGTCSAYRCGPLIDLCKGPHIANTGLIKAMAVTSNASAYWLGKAENASLQRVYGISFPDEKQLEEYQERMRWADERDHRKVGVAQRLFFFHELSPGSCFFLPHGARIYNGLQNFIRKQYRKRGYDEVISPNVFNVDLWKTSGHYANYKENMFMFEVEGQQFGMKPMNCPGHCLMFRSALHSYKELPLRYADFGVLHRNEISGALTGLTRVRRFQQDDAHIFARHDQIEDEVAGVLDMLQEVYGLLGFKFSLMLSTRPEKFLGELEMWDKAELALAQALDKFGQEWSVNPADGAFYGPKIDIQLMDALKRRHQCATIQLDFQLPIRFGLSYKAEGEGFETPVMIHRAILGSVERMMAVLIEHTGGKWPFWLSPRQIMIITIAEKYMPYGREVRDFLHQHGFYVDIDDTNKQLPKKIREAQIHQYNLILVCGEEEQSKRSVNVRFRDSPDDKVLWSLDELLKNCQGYLEHYK